MKGQSNGGPRIIGACPITAHECRLQVSRDFSPYGWAGRLASKGINQYITETASNLSTDMAITLSKLFMRTISQNPNENQTGISLWTLEDIEKHQAKQKELALLAEKEAQVEKRRDEAMDVDEDEDYGDGGIDDSMLAEIDLDV